MEQHGELTKLQRSELGILDALIRLLDENGLTYYLAAGTLLGAVRHQGFIPWDDDVDICMPRSQYEKFLALAETGLPEKYRTVYFKKQQDGERLLYYCQVQDTTVPVMQYIAKKPIKTYAWVDVFPLDGLPEGLFAKKLHGFRLLYRRARMQLSMFDENVNLSKKNRPFAERFLIWLHQKTGLGKNSSPRRMMEKLDRALKSRSCETSGIWVCFMGAYKLREAYPKDVYGEGKLYPFEGRMLTGPLDAHTYLSTLYGDYRTPRPPQNEEETHRLQPIEEQNAELDNGGNFNG